MALLAFLISGTITASLNRNIDLLARYGNAMVARKEIKSSEPYFIKIWSRTYLTYDDSPMAR